MASEYTVAAVREALSVLMIVAHQPGLGSTEIGKRSGNTKARSFRLLSTLEECGYVRRQRDARTYELGPIALVLGLAAQQQVRLTRLADRHLHALHRRFNETVSVVVRNDLGSVAIAQLVSTHEVCFQVPLGRYRALHAGASGKTLLAHGSAELQARVLGSELVRYATATPFDRSRLAQDLQQIREQGYAVSASEVSADVFAIAAPVFDDSGQVEATLSMSMPASRRPVDPSLYIGAVRRGAEDLSIEMGWKRD